MSKHIKRNQMMSLVIIVLVMIVTFCATYFGTKASFDQGTVELKNTITESVTTSVGVDTPGGRPHLQDVLTGADVSTRSYGDSVNARNLVTVDGTLVRCLSTEEVALLAEDVQHGTDVRLSFVDPTSELVTKTYALSMGDFHDENSFLSFGSDKVRVILDSDICNQADVSPSVEGSESEEPEVEEEEDIKLDIELALESAIESTTDIIDSDEGVFDRNLRRQQAAVGSVVSPQGNGKEDTVTVPANPSSSVNEKDDILKRHRDAYAFHRAAIQSGRQLRNLQFSFNLPVFDFGDQYVGASCGGQDQFCCWSNDPCPGNGLVCDYDLPSPTCVSTSCTSPFASRNDLRRAVNAYIACETDCSNPSTTHGVASGHINTWCTSGITNMRQLFYLKNDFNEDINGWDTSAGKSVNFV